MPTVSVDIPFQYRAHAAARRKRAAQHLVVRATTRVEVALIEDGHMPFRRARGDNRNAFFALDRVYRECRKADDARTDSPIRIEDFEAFVASCLDPKARPIRYAHDNPFSIPRLAGSRKDLVSAMPVVHENDLTGVISSDRDTMERLALIDAEHMAFIGGHLYSSRSGPVVGLSRTDDSSRARFQVIATTGFADRLTPQFQDMSHCVSHMEASLMMEEGTAFCEQDVDLLTDLHPYPGHAVAVISGAMDRLAALIPRGKSISAIGSGFLSATDTPEALDEVAFDIRRQLRMIDPDFRAGVPPLPLLTELLAMIVDFDEHLLKATSDPQYRTKIDESLQANRRLAETLIDIHHHQELVVETPDQQESAPWKL